ncbi:MAG: hypothetical protein AAFR88_07440, partial [Pseudomonadota bacterium]
MKNRLPLRLSHCALIALASLTAACSGAEIEQCTARLWTPTAKKQGFELIDLPSGEVWLTRDWDQQTFNAFDLPLSWSLWRKNDPRTGAASSGRFLHSPGCEAGEFTYMKALGREFLHVVDLANMGETPPGTGGLVRMVSLTKHHVIKWDAGAPIQ